MTDDEKRRDRYDPRGPSGIRRSSIIFWLIVVAVLVVMFFVMWGLRNTRPPDSVPAPDTTSVPDTTVLPR